VRVATCPRTRLTSARAEKASESKSFMLSIVVLVVRCVLCLAGVALAVEVRVGDGVKESDERVLEKVKKWNVSREKG